LIDHKPLPTRRVICLGDLFHSHYNRSGSFW
jgi:hypothetical protein